MNVKIRQEIPDDFNAVFEVNKLTFGQDNEAKLVELLRQSNAFVPELSLVATVDNKLIGHILFSKSSLLMTIIMNLKAWHSLQWRLYRSFNKKE